VETSGVVVRSYVQRTFTEKATSSKKSPALSVCDIFSYGLSPSFKVSPPDKNVSLLSLGEKK